MKIGLSLLNICFVLLISCGNDKPIKDIDEAESTKQEVTITSRAIENFKYKDYALSANAEQAVANWEKYQELAIQISYLRKADLSFFDGDKELLKKFIEAFKLALPTQFNTNPVVSRMAIIETSLLRLNDNLTLDNIDGRVKLKSVKEVLVAFSNLNYQVNKKLERDKYEKIKAEYK
jgi:hypothetical protein